jgi:hypothetical protein
MTNDISAEDKYADTKSFWRAGRAGRRIVKAFGKLQRPTPVSTKKCKIGAKEYMSDQSGREG